MSLVMENNYMDTRASLNIVDHYYYPDSDLETIQEESSVADSEDERSLHQDFWRSVDATAAASRFRFDPGRRTSDSDLSHSSMSSSSTPRLLSDKPQNNKDPISSDFTNAELENISPVNGYHNSSSYVSYNGYNDLEVDNDVDPLPQQRIVYAKCLTPKAPIGLPKDQFRAKSNLKEPHATITDMFQAAREGNLSALASFPASELSDTVDESGNTTLHVAAEHGRLACLKKLATTYTPQMVTLPNDDLTTPTALAVKNGHLECVQWLVRHTEAKSELTMSQRASSIDGSNTRPPLAHVAARFDQSEILDWICEEMLREGIAIDAADHCSNTAVHVGARYGHLRSIQTLVARGASVTVLNSDGDTPGQAAQKHGHYTTVGYLVVVETCVSLAQQLVALRNDMDGLKVENEKLRNDLATNRSSHTKSQLEEKCSNGVKMNQKQEISNPPKNTEQSDTSGDLNGSSVGSENNQQKRRPLQQQPPPPQLFLPKKNSDSTANRKVLSSIKGHAAVSSVKSKSSLDNDSLQRKINAALNGPGTAIDSNNTFLRVTDIEHNAAKEKEVKSKANTIRNNPKDLNSEVESITKDIEESNQRKPWEKLTMDEMLKMVRDIRYQPSPSISMCTEDSTMEPVEVMREKMAAASRWFLVEKGQGGKTKNLPPSVTPRNALNQDRWTVGDFHISKNAPRMKNEPLRATAQLATMTHRQSANKLQTAIQQHYERSAEDSRTYQQSHSQRDNLGMQPNSRLTSESKPMTQPTNQKDNVVQTGTLKFKVSNSTFPTYSKSPQKNVKRSPNGKSSTSSSNSASPKTSSPQTPEGTPPVTPTVGTTQRSNSYRRALQHRQQAEDVTNLSNSPSSSVLSYGSSSRGSANNVQAELAKETKRSTKINWTQPEKPSKQKRNYDPLQKRSGSEMTLSPTYSQPQVIASVKHESSVSKETKTNSSNKLEKATKYQPPPQSNNRIRSTQHKFFNTWSMPGNSKGMDSLKRLNISHQYDDEDDEARELSEVPEIKTEIPSRQSSFLRKVQGKRK